MDIDTAVIGLAAILVMGMLVLIKSIRIINEYERGVLFRLGRVDPALLKNPGLRLILPFVDRMVKVDLRTVTLDVPPQEVITKDNVTISVNAVVYFNVMNPTDAAREEKYEQRAAIEAANRQAIREGRKVYDP